MVLQTTLGLVAAAIAINLWHFIRIVHIRAVERIIHGDGGNTLLMRRMRAHANFIENVPLTLLAIAGIELSGHGGRWLAIVGGALMLARIAHGIGLDAQQANPARVIGVGVTLMVQLGLAVVAVLIVLGRF